jgi:hypothetical protein
VDTEPEVAKSSSEEEQVLDDESESLSNTQNQTHLSLGIELSIIASMVLKQRGQVCS